MTINQNKLLNKAISNKRPLEACDENKEDGIISEIPLITPMLKEIRENYFQSIKFKG